MTDSTNEGAPKPAQTSLLVRFLLHFSLLLAFAGISVGAVFMSLSIYGTISIIFTVLGMGLLSIGAGMMWMGVYFTAFKEHAPNRTDLERIIIKSNLKKIEKFVDLAKDLRMPEEFFRLLEEEKERLLLKKPPEDPTADLFGTEAEVFGS